MENSYLAPEGVAKILNVSLNWIYEHTRRGSRDRLPSYRIGKHLRFKREDIETWIEKHKNECFGNDS